MVWGRGNKYNVAPASERVFQGRTYASKAERLYAEILWSRLKQRTIQLLIEQPTLWLGVPENVYRPDFFVMVNGQCQFIDVKGVETPAFRKVKKLWASYGQCPLHIIKRNRPAAVVLSEEEYRRLSEAASQPIPGMTALEWLLSQPGLATRDPEEIDASLASDRAW